jgi:hypothetical protein
MSGTLRDFGCNIDADVGKIQQERLAMGENLTCFPRENCLDTNSNE